MKISLFGKKKIHYLEKKNSVFGKEKKIHYLEKKSLFGKKIHYLEKKKKFIIWKRKKKLDVPFFGADTDGLGS